MLLVFERYELLDFVENWIGQMNPGFNKFVAIRRTEEAVQYLNGRLFIVWWPVNLVFYSTCVRLCTCWVEWEHKSVRIVTVNMRNSGVLRP
jgi:hypothetical protein